MMFKKKEFADCADNTNEILNRKEEKNMDSKVASQNTEQIVKQWQRDAEQLKLIVPDFLMESALKSKAFTDKLRRGATVFEAYKAMLDGEKPQEKRQEIFQNARSARRGTGGASLNPAKLSSDDFKKYIDNIRNN